MLMRREVIDDVGGFDLRFGLGNFEDDDICIRAGVAGYSCLVARDSFVHHFGSRTFAGAGIKYSDSLEHNWQLFSQKWQLAPTLVNGGRGYDPSKVLATTNFDHSRHYAPLVGRFNDLERAVLDAKSSSILIALPKGYELHEIFQYACETYSATDDVTIVVRIHPGDSHAYKDLERVADSIGGSLPDVVVVEHDSLNDAALVKACDTVLILGRCNVGALESLAYFYGKELIHVDEDQELLTVSIVNQISYS